MRIALIGPMFFVSRLAADLRRRNHSVVEIFHEALWKAGPEMALHMLNNVDVAYFMYGALRNPVLAHQLYSRRSTKIIIHFIGSDVLEFHRATQTEKKDWLTALGMADRILAVTPQLVKRLAPQINAEFFPLNFRNLNCEFTPYPKRFTVLTYLPHHAPTFYGIDLIFRLIHDFPDLQFIELGHHPGLAAPNVTQMAIEFDRDMETIYRRTSVLIRLTEHDGLSNMVMESLARGRQVIWTQPMPFCHLVSREYPSIRSALDVVRTSTANQDAIKWVRSAFDHEQIVDHLESIFQNPQIDLHDYRKILE